MATRTFTITAALMLGISLGVNLSGDDQESRERTNWSEIISSKSIEAEVAWLHSQLEQNVSTQVKFSRGGYRLARRHFSELAMLFGIIEQSEAPMKWSKSASQLRLRFARTASNCKVGTQQVFNDVNEAKAKLQSLLAGDELPVIANADVALWSEIVDIPPLMQQMNQWQTQIKEKLADQKSFDANRDQIKRRAELIAAVAAVIRQPMMEYDEDPEFADHAKNLSRHADVLGRVVDRNDRNAARVAHRLLLKNCDNCHENYR